MLRGRSSNGLARVPVTTRPPERTGSRDLSAKTRLVQFSLGVNYWPRRTASAMWRYFDAGEIAADFAHIAALGLDTVRFFLRWDAFAPHADVIDTTMLERLETIVTLAGEAGLHAVPTLFCGYMDGVTWLPDWALDRRVCASRAGNMYTGALLDAQLLFARAAARHIGNHPALSAWDIGNEFSNVRQPSHVKVTAGEHSQAPADERMVANWSRRLCEALHETSPVPVSAGTSSADLTQERDLRLGSLCAPFAFASMQGFSVDSGFARNRLDPEMLPFLAMLTAAFSFKPVLISGFGNPTCPPNKFSAFERFALPGEPPNVAISPADTVFATYPCLTEAENAAYCTSVLERLQRDGRLGAYWWCWSDYADDGPEREPFVLAPQWKSFGILRVDGSEKPVAAALRAFAAQRREVAVPSDMPMISSTYYYRTLPTSTRTLYESFLRFVSARRMTA